MTHTRPQVKHLVSSNRFTFLLAGAVIGAWLLWVSFAKFVVPSLIASAYHGKSLEVLNAMISGQDKHSLDYYLNAWRKVSYAIQLVFLATGFISILLTRAELNNRAKICIVKMTLCTISAVVFIVAILSGSRHDYASYLRQWEIILEGGKPWGPGLWNSYGPLYNILAFLAKLNPFGPKILFSFAWVACGIFLIDLFAKMRAPAYSNKDQSANRIASNRFTFLLAGAFIGTWLLWVSFAKFVVPNLIASAYHGKSLEVLNAMISGQDKHSLDYYLNAWRRMSDPIQLVFLATGLVSILVTRLELKDAISHGGLKGVWALAAFFFANPFFWYVVAVNGTFDILPATACLGAVHLRLKNKDVAAGALLGAAVLLKYYPIVALPFLMLDGKRLRIRLGLSCGLFVTLGLLLSHVIWGPCTFYPLVYAGVRESKMLSIFRFLRGSASPVRALMDSPDLDYLSLPSMIVFGGLSFIACYYKRVAPTPGALIGLVIALTFYKVGHGQFYVVVFLLSAYWYVHEHISFANSRRLSLVFASYLGLISLHELLYGISAQLYNSQWGFTQSTLSLWREVIGFPTFILACWVVAEIFRRVLTAGEPPLVI